MTHQFTPGGAELFDCWVQHQMQKPRDPLSKSAAAPYAAIWTAWLRHVSAVDIVEVDGSHRTLRWNEARAEHVSQFLRPRNGQKAGHNPERTLSEVTRRRYWRVLDRIYLFAVQRGWITTSPVAELPEEATPRVTKQLGHVLPDTLWSVLPSYFPTGDSMYEVRDRAILFLLYELALAPEEIRNLRPTDITFDESESSLGKEPVSMSIRGKRQHQNRTLLMMNSSRAAVRSWIEWRAAHQKSCASEWLFVSNRGTQIAISVLFSAVSDSVLRASEGSGSNDAHGLPKRVGPQVIRNTAIVQLLKRGISRVDVVNYIGIKNDKGLRRLFDAG